jgi:hypothetical protein
MNKHKQTFLEWMCGAGFSKEEIQDVVKTTSLQELPTKQELDDEEWGKGRVVEIKDDVL